MRRREIASREAAPAHLRPISISELPDSIDDVTDEEVQEAFRKRPPVGITYDGKESIHHIMDLGGKAVCGDVKYQV